MLTSACARSDQCAFSCGQKVKISTFRPQASATVLFATQNYFKASCGHVLFPVPLHVNTHKIDQVTAGRHVRHSQERKWCTMDYHVTTICNNGRTPNCFGPDKDTAKGREIAAAPSIRCQCPSRVFTMDIHFDAPTALTLGCGALFLGREFCRSKVYPGHWGHCAIGRIRFKEANHPSVKSPVMLMNGSKFN